MELSLPSFDTEFKQHKYVATKRSSIDVFRGPFLFIGSLRQPFVSGLHLYFVRTATPGRAKAALRDSWEVSPQKRSKTGAEPKTEKNDVFVGTEPKNSKLQ